MSRCVKRGSKRRAAKRIPSAAQVPPAPAVEPASLPLPSPDPSTESASALVGPKFKHLPDDSIVRRKALAIVALELAGYNRADIAKELEISEASISPYKYLAGKHGWLDHHDPKDRLEYSLGHKVVRNLEAALDSADEKLKIATTLEVAKGTIFKKFDSQVQAPGNQNILAIKIEFPEGIKAQVTPGTVGGTPESYIEGAVLEE